MTRSTRQSFLELSIIWKDEHMFEVLVQTSHADFSGRTQVYETSERLAAFASALLGYPAASPSLFYEAGEKNSYAYFSMRLYPLGIGGIAGLEVTIESNVTTEFRPEEKSKLNLEIIIEPWAIDNFQKQLFHLAVTQAGVATLYGRDHTPAIRL